MTDSEVDQLVLDVVRKYTTNESAAAGSRFEQDLRLTEAARGMLFASLAQAFSARGVSLPGRLFYLSDFLTCPTPAAAADAIRAKVFGVGSPKAEAPAAAPIPTPTGKKAKAAVRRPKQVGKKPVIPKKKTTGAPRGRRGKR
jgi:hypothetical protein